MDALDTSALPPGFGFHPTDVELVSYYLKKKIFGVKSEVEVIPEVDIYKHEPWDLPAKTRIPSRDGKWHFFNTRDRKYPTGSRSNRATKAGYWKSTGKDRMIRSHGRVIGTKKTLVFHKGRPPHGKRTDWIMHEYYLNESEYKKAVLKEIFVLCRITNRSAAGAEDEEVTAQVDGINDPYAPLILESLPKMLEDTPNVNGQSVELPSHEDLNCEAWIQELYDPNFGTILAATGCKIELDEVDSSFIGLNELGGLHFPMNFENVSLTGGSNLHFPQEYDNNLPGDFFFDDLVTQSIFDVNISPFLDSHISLLDFIDSRDSGTTQCGTYEPAAKDILVNHIAGPSTHRIKLQVNKMMKKNTEPTNHIVVLENTNCHLDFGGLQEPVVPKKAQAAKQGIPRIKEEIKLEESETESHENYTFKGYSCRVHGVSSSRFRVRATVKNLVRRALREALVLRSRCAPISPRCMFRGTCLTGAAAAFTGYIIQEHA